MKTIPLTKGYVALVDDEDFEVLSKFKWRALVKNGNRAVYAMRTTSNLEGKPKSILMHAAVCGYSRPDHIDGDGLNNQKSNFRPATRAQNGANRRSHAGASSPFLGVHWYRLRGKWRAQITYNLAAFELHGEFAHFNTPRIMA